MLWLFVSAKLLDTWLHNDLFSFLTSLEYKYQKCLNEMYSIFVQFFFTQNLRSLIEIQNHLQCMLFPR